jgi:hypothetical protein
MRGLVVAAVCGLLLQLSACANSVVPGPESAKVLASGPKAGFAALYVGRPYGWNVSYIPLSVELNGQPLAQLDIKTYTRVELRPGTYRLAAADTYMTSITYGKPVPLDLRVEAGRSYFVLPTRRVDNVRPAIQIINKTVVTTQTGDVSGGFALQKPGAKGQPPSEFTELSYVAAEYAAK